MRSSAGEETRFIAIIRRGKGEIATASQPYGKSKLLAVRRGVASPMSVSNVSQPPHQPLYFVRMAGLAY